MLLDLNKPFVNFDDVSLKESEKSDALDLLMNRVLANKLIGPGKENIAKLYDWSLTLWKTGKISIDRADVNLLKSIIETDENWTLLIKGQLLIELDNLKESKLEKVKQ